jgi:NTE family protein
VPRIGLVLGGGGLTGTAFHAGVITALAETVGWDARTAEVIVGTSAGATAAALMRAGFPPADYVPRVAGLPMSAEGRAILGHAPPLATPQAPATASRRRPASRSLLRSVVRAPWRYPVGVLGTALLPEGRRDVTATAALFDSLFSAWPDDPLWVCAVRLSDGERVVFGRDQVTDVAAAVSASCAVPGYFAPVSIDDVRYVDGGVHSLTNVDVVAGLDLDLVVVSAPMGTTDVVANDAGNALRLPARSQLARETARLRRRGTSVVMLQPDRRLRSIMGTRAMDASRRRPVALATRDYAASVLGQVWPVSRARTRAMPRPPTDEQAAHRPH